MSSHAHCRHGHSHGSSGKTEEANWKTWANTFTEFSIDFASTAALLGSMVDYMLRSDDTKDLGYSMKGLAIAAPFALLVAGGATFCHFFLKKQTQKEKSHASTVVPVTEDPEAAITVEVPPKKTLEEELGEMRRRSSRVAEDRKKESQNKLTLCDKFALVGDAISHTADVAGPLNQLVRILGLASLSLGWQLTGVSGLWLLSVLGSIADIRACGVVLKEENQRSLGIKKKDEPEKEERADGWTIFSAAMEWPVEFSSNASLVAAALSYLWSSKRVDGLGYSPEGIAFGSIFGFLTASSGVYCHFLRNAQLQTTQTLDDSGIDSVSLPLWKKAVWFFDGAGHVGDFAGPVLLVAQISGLAQALIPIQLLVFTGFLGVGTVGSLADFQTCGRALKMDQMQRDQRRRQTALIMDSGENPLRVSLLDRPSNGHGNGHAHAFEAGPDPSNH